MLGRHKLKVGYGEQTVRETKRNADAFKTPTLLDGEVCQRDMTVPGHEDQLNQQFIRHSPSPSCMPNLKLLSSTVAEINSLLWLSTVIKIHACLPVGGATSRIPVRHSQGPPLPGSHGVQGERDGEQGEEEGEEARREREGRKPRRGTRAKPGTAQVHYIRVQ